MTPHHRSLWEALRAHRRCPRCGRGYPIAPACLAAHLDPIPHDGCPRCAQRRWHGHCVSLGCRRGWVGVGTTHVALGYKEGAVERLRFAAKDAADPAAVTLLGRLLAGFLLQHTAIRGYDVIIPVPFHPAGLRGRPVHPLTAIYSEAASALRPRIPLDDLAPPFLVQVRQVPPGAASGRTRPLARRARGVRAWVSDAHAARGPNRGDR